MGISRVKIVDSDILGFSTVCGQVFYFWHPLVLIEGGALHFVGANGAKSKYLSTFEQALDCEGALLHAMSSWKALTWIQITNMILNSVSLSSKA